MPSPVKSFNRIINLLKDDVSREHSSFIFFITSICNQACEFCFFRNSINRSIDLTLSDIKILSSKIGYISNMLFSGGEPTLRKDLLEIIDVFVENNKIKALTIPSNGMSKDFICKIVKQILTKYPLLSLQVCISLDGPEDLHDKLRGIAGAYCKAVESIKALDYIAMQSNRFFLNINTVIAPMNVGAIENIIQDIKYLGIKNYTHSFEIVRPKNIKSKKYLFDNIDKLKKAYSVILKYKDGIFLKKLKCNILKKTILGALHYANIYTLYKIQFDYSIKSKKWPMRCCAGLDDNVIYNNGDLSICELQEPFNNIKNLLDRESLNGAFEEQKYRSSNCYCSHVCYILLSMYKSKKILFFLMPLHALRYFIVKLGIFNYF